VPKDARAAVIWFRKAADHGDATAKFNLGLIYANGEGVPQDFTAAVSWYRDAAEHGFADAQYNLGTMYGSGKGVPQDYVTAHMWFDLAATGGNQEALQDREAVERRMTPAQIAEAQKLARDWKPRSN
jgi:TPR repeat protein